jgi:hypothetical protein
LALQPPNLAFWMSNYIDVTPYSLWYEENKFIKRFI